MDPALLELLRHEAAGDREVEAVIRLAAPDAHVAGVRIVSRFGPVATCRLRQDAILGARSNPIVKSLKASRLLGPDLERQSAAGPVGHDRRRPPGMPWTGAGVVVGVLDWGCDFDCPSFKRPDGSTRLLGLWDQRGPRSPASPEPYGYGRFHGRARIDAALGTAHPYETLGYHPGDADRYRSGSHGTHVLDIAAGNGQAGGPAGVAPGSHLVFVHLADRGTGGLANLGDSVRILEAVDFVTRIAGTRPWVINLSLGQCGGPHDGKTLMELAFDALLGGAPDRFMVLSGGNYFASATHAKGLMRPGHVETLRFVTDPADSTTNELEVWYGGADELVVEVASPTGSTTPLVHLGQQVDVIVGGRLVGRLYHRRCDPNNHDNQIDLFLYPWAPAGNWTVNLGACRVVDGVFHAWLERDERCARCQTRFVQASIDTSCTTGTIANGHLPLVVGAYDAHSPARALAPFSSAGPTRDGRMKPEIMAPGLRVLAARSAPRGSRQSPGTGVRKSGTSMAAPHVTGTAALCLQARSFAAADLRALLFRTATPAVTDRDRSGHGFLDIAATVQALPDGSDHRLRPRRRRVAGTTPTRDCGEVKPGSASATLVAIGPARLYRALAYRRGPIPGWIDATYSLLARPGQVPSANPAAGDLLLRVALGELGSGFAAVLLGPPMVRSELRASQVNAEGGGPGMYALVIDCGESPPNDDRRVALRILDSRGRVPAGQMLLRPRASSPEGQATLPR